MGDASISSGGQKEHLVFKGIRGERPAVAENNRLSVAPILVVNLGASFHSNRGHMLFSSLFLSRRKAFGYVLVQIVIFGEGMSYEDDA
jgi:hypothetical protein